MGDSGGRHRKVSSFRDPATPLTGSTPPPLCEMGLSKVPGSTLQAQMSLDVQIEALPPWSSSLSLALPPAHPRPARKPSRVARRDSWDRTGWAQWPPDDCRVLQKAKC